MSDTLKEEWFERFGSWINTPHHDKLLEAQWNWIVDHFSSTKDYSNDYLKKWQDDPFPKSNIIK